MTPSANDFLAVSQFTVATPGRAPNIRPDVVLCSSMASRWW